MCGRNHRHSIFCIVPPFVLNSIVRNGSAAQRTAAAQTLALDTTFRHLRTQMSVSVPLALRRPRLAGLEPVKQRTICTADNSATPPGRIVRTEGAPATNDPAVDEAYDGLGATFDFLQRVYARNSIDDEGLPLSATVHFEQDFNNAYWNGQRMVFGDGDGQLFKRFTIALDIIAHELGHGITQDESGL